MNKGKLVAFEGIDGSGKSTQCALLKIQLDRVRVPSVITKAKPKDLDRVFHQFIKEFSISSDSVAYMFLYQCLHRLQYDKSTETISGGDTAIADRWNLSYFVYHNMFGELSKKSAKLRKELDLLAFCGQVPDIGFYLDIPVDVAINRRISRGEKFKDLEKEKELYEKVRDQYKSLLDDNWIVIDGTGTILDIHHQVVKLVLDRVR